MFKDANLMHDLVQNTVEYYTSAPKLRALGDDICMYKTSDGRNCAVGRLFSTVPENIERCNASDILSRDEVIGKLKPAYKWVKNCLPFTDILQELHDNKVFWKETPTETRLTSRGRQAVVLLHEYINRGAYVNLSLFRETGPNA